MKKLKLKLDDLVPNELLTREQLKNVFGGDGPGGGSGSYSTCTVTCPEGGSVQVQCVGDCGTSEDSAYCIAGDDGHHYNEQKCKE